jgi:short-subunit dehydrogenase
MVTLMTSQPGALRPLALVTGASSGIGRAYAQRLAASGYDLVVVARRADRLEELKETLQRDHGVSVQTLVADLSTDAGMSAVESSVDDPRLQFVVDCAALAYYMPFVNLPAATAEELIKLNVLAPVRMIHAALPGMLERGAGTIVTFASLLAFGATADMPQLPKRTVYAATKAFMLAFTRLLAVELRDTGVRLQVVCPGVVKTEFHTRQNLDFSHMPRLESEQVVDASLRGMELGEVVCIPTLEDGDVLVGRDGADMTVLSNGMRPVVASRYSAG